jgi:thymidylate synthase
MDKRNINLDYMLKLSYLMRKFEFESAPRHLKIKEFINDGFIVDMDKPIITIPERKLNHNFMTGEAWWILDGRNDVRSLSKYMGKIKRYSDDGVRFFGAYGPKIVDQLSYCIKILVEDRDTRQSCLTIWRQNPPFSKDIPCTVSLQFFLREDRLYTVANMRSQDIWLGLPYDAFNFSAISFFMCLSLRDILKQPTLKLGELYINAASRHIYETNYQEARKVSKAPIPDHLDFSFNRALDNYKDPYYFITALKLSSDHFPTAEIFTVKDKFKRLESSKII